jgi:hypothetical protein
VPLLPLLPVEAPKPGLGDGVDVAGGALEAASPTETPTVRGPEPLGFGAPAWCGDAAAGDPAEPAPERGALPVGKPAGEAVEMGAAVRPDCGEAGASAGAVSTSPLPPSPGRVRGSPASAKWLSSASASAVKAARAVTPARRARSIMSGIARRRLAKAGFLIASSSPVRGHAMRAIAPKTRLRLGHLSKFARAAQRCRAARPGIT